MAYTGNDPNLIDLQNQITANLNSQNKSEAMMQTQIKQVTLTLEGELNTLAAAFNALKAFVQTGGSPTISQVNGVTILSGNVDPSAGAGVQSALPALYVRNTDGVVWSKTGTAATAWTQI